MKPTKWPECVATHFHLISNLNLRGSCQIRLWTPKSGGQFWGKKHSSLFWINYFHQKPFPVNLTDLSDFYQFHQKGGLSCMTLQAPWCTRKCLIQFTIQFYNQLQNQLQTQFQNQFHIYFKNTFITNFNLWIYWYLGKQFRKKSASDEDIVRKCPDPPHYGPIEYMRPNKYLFSRTPSHFSLFLLISPHASSPILIQSNFSYCTAVRCSHAQQSHWKCRFPSAAFIQPSAFIQPV